MQINFDPRQQRAEEKARGIKYEGHSDEHLALQGHSIDDLYPWSVVIVREGLKGIGSYCYPKQLVSGQEGPRFSFRSWDEFGSAHQSSEKWIRDHKGCCITQTPTAKDVI